MHALRDDERGSSTVEFVLVGTLLTLLTLGVLQLALAVYVRNVVHDAAVEGAYFGALADTDAAAGATRTAQLIETAVGAGIGAEVTAADTESARGPEIEVRVVATLPLVVFLGVPAGWEVTARAPRESFD
ncbi:TadE/TadG family type IV pilus assembly protein [Microbacterium hominis]|uniref:TadE/TadG family type IV pilus assembly protein n=1 Tax=Microbacterium hominis TaxID=162426 RepID=UPI00076869AB|nr:TadE/TadG family type IV pilus assembly protein [Microbacterium hominis]KXC06305.1 TadE family protein [Microbacterium hominis]